MSKPILSITLDFDASQVQALLNAANFGDEGAVQAKDLTKDQLEALAEDMCPESLAEEIVETAYDACANDWLSGWRGEDEDDD